ncbi:MAG TPA: hypothetical protein VIX87_03430 [Steroidobacteraceae bacterium]
MKTTVSLSIALSALVATASHGFEGGRELLLSAPIEHIGAGSVTVLGKDFDTSTDNLAVGEVVNIYGLLKTDGSMTDTVVEGTNSFGASGDPVFLKGVVTDANAALGNIKVDGATVDYTPQLGSSDFSAPATGDVVAVAGSQPLVKGVVLASAFGTQAYAAAIPRAGFNVAAMTGGGIHSSAMTGGGIHSAAMTGGGIQSDAMTGGGIHSDAMTGGGIQSDAMTGGGIHSDAMTGGGIQSDAMTGGGIQSDAMTGGGIHSSAMTGGGIQSDAMTGGGIETR